jgi:hypothetical protein
MFNGVSFDQMIACLAREIAMRQRVYPKWIDQGRMNPDTADKEIRHMEAILGYIKNQAGRRD